MDLSNKSLALVLLAAIVISLGTTVINLNKLSQVGTLGGATDLGITGRVPGWAAVNITSVVGCAVDSNVDFGTNVTSAVVLSSDADNSASGFNSCNDNVICSGMEINNTGNNNLLVNFSSEQAGIAFIGGPSAVDADFQYLLRNGTNATLQPGCQNSSGITFEGWATVPVVNTTICLNLTFNDTQDMMDIEYNVTLRADTTAGQKNTTINVFCFQN